MTLKCIINVLYLVGGIFSAICQDLSKENFVVFKDGHKLHFKQVSYIPGNGFILTDSITFPIHEVQLFRNHLGYFVSFENKKFESQFLLRSAQGKVNTYKEYPKKVINYYQIGDDPILKINYKNLKTSFQGDPENLDLVNSIHKKYIGIFPLVLGGALMFIAALDFEDCSGLSTQRGWLGGSPKEACESRNSGRGFMIGLGFSIALIGKSVRSGKQRMKFVNFIDNYNSQPNINYIP